MNTILSFLKQALWIYWSNILWIIYYLEIITLILCVMGV